MTDITPHSARVRHIDHLNLTVESLESSIRFYRRLFEFEPVERDAEAKYPWAILRSGEAMLCLYEHAGVPVGPRYPEVPREQGLRHFALRITNQLEFAEFLRQQCIPLLFGSPVRWPHSTSYYLEDPTGHHIEAVAWDEEEIRFPVATRVG